MTLATGTRVGVYEVVSLIGRGGMGEVYRARDTRLGREVALKVLPAAFAGDAERLARFQREATVLASLNHPHIASIYGLEESEGISALVMELVDGPTLAERMAAGPVSVAEALAIARQIAEAVESAHEKGIIHRDLKPANVKLTGEGAVKVLDFGLAKALSGESAGGDPVDSPTLSLAATRAGVILGTAAYMSPEQARGAPADRRADIWAFGVVLFEMLVGRQTFAGETVSDTLAAVLRAELEWSALPPDTPAAIRRLLRRCLERDRKKRLHDIADARLEIDEALAGSPEAPTASAVQSQIRGGSRWWIAATALATLAALTLAVVHLRESQPAPDTVRFNIPLPEKTSFAGHLSISPDGRRVAFAGAGADGRMLLWIRALDQLEARPLAGTENSGYYFWSPDSRYIAFWADGRLKRIDASGGPAQILSSTPLALGGTWNADGVILYGSNASGIARVPAAGGKSETVTKLNASQQETYHAWPFFLPDGKHYLYMVDNAQQGARTIYAGSLDSSIRKRLITATSGAYYVPSAGADKGHLLYLREATLMAQAFDTRRLETTGEPFPVAEQVGSFLSRGYFSSSLNGVLVHRTGSSLTGQLEWFDRQGKSLGRVGAPGVYNGLDLAPDGTRVAVTRPDVGSGRDIWLLDAIRGTTTRFTFDPAEEMTPAWAPDGGRIAFSSSRNGPFDLYRKISSGAGNDDLVLRSEFSKRVCDWSRDGRYLLYTVDNQKTKSDLWVLSDPAGGGDHKPTPYLQTEFNEGLGQFSPNGRWVTYVSDETGRMEVYVQPFPASGGKWQVSTAGGMQPRWSRDGKELFYIGTNREMISVPVKTEGQFEVGIPKPLFTTRMAFTTLWYFFRYAVAPDGKRFLIDSVEEGPASASAAPITVLVNWKPGRQ